MSDDRLLFERRGSAAWLTLNRPEIGNAIDREMTHALVDAAVSCDADPTVRCVILTGSGRMFCAGGDIGLFASAGDGRHALFSEAAGLLHLAMAKLARMRKPLLVLVNGPAAGAGLGLAMVGDVVIAAASAHFTAGYTAIGLTPDGGLSWLLPRLVGLRRAQEMVLTNRRVLAAEAERIGLVTRVVEDAALAAEGASIAEALSRAATSAMGVVRALLLDSFTNDIETQMELETRCIAAASATSEGEEGISAFLAKRKPVFT